MVSESLALSEEHSSVKTENGAVLKSTSCGVIGESPLSDAIRALFSTGPRKGGSEKEKRVDSTGEFLARVDAAIHACECDLTVAARAGRGDMEGALSRGNTVRDSVGAHSAHLADSRKLLSDVRERAEGCADLLEERMRVRANLDAALVLVANTRKLVRTYARVEDVLAERRLHTALNMLNAIEKNDSKSPDAAKLLAYVYQRASRLKNEVNYRAAALFKEAMKAAHVEIGKYALKHIKTPGWTPAITSHNTTTTKNNNNNAKQNAEPMSLNALNDAASSADGGYYYYDDNNNNNNIELSTPPKLYIRPLLQCVQIYEDLGRSAELQAEYRREREKQLRGALDNSNNNMDIGEVEKALQGVAGIMVVEKTIAPYAPDLLDNSVLIKELWRMAHSTLMKSALRCYSSNNNSNNNSNLNSNPVKLTLDAFAKAYSLPL